MNHQISQVGAAVVTVTVFLFAVCLITDFTFGSYLVCMFLPIGYIMMAAGFVVECKDERKAAAFTGLAFAAVYAVLILLVYYAQTTSVRLESLSTQAVQILDYRRGGLMFNYDLLGYGMMALSTLFIGLSFEPASRTDRWLRRLMLIHGAFFISCFVMPMTGVFTGMSHGNGGIGGRAALVIWCVYFLPVGVLAWLHFARGRKNT